MKTAEEIMAALSAPFDASEIKFKPQAVSSDKTKAMAVPYIDARVVEDRLDQVFGVNGWKTAFREFPGGTIVCTLEVKIDGEWITREDVGNQSEQPDEGDRIKSAFSDALKRVAVQLGIGRYLYRQKPQWVDYDPQKKRFTATPRLPGVTQKPSNGMQQARPSDPEQRVQPQARPQELSELVQQWIHYLQGNPAINGINDGIKEMQAVENKEDKKAVWKLMKNYADGKGWEFDEEKKCFAEPAQTTRF